MKLFSILLILFGLTLSSCSVTESDINGYIDRFYNNKSDFDRIITSVSTNGTITSRIGYFINKNDLDEDTQVILSKLDITDLSTSSSDCKGIAQYELEADWTTKVHIYFTKDKCDYVETKRGFRKQASEYIEVYGLGDNWLMWIDYDLL